MRDIEHHNDNDSRKVTSVLSGKDYRLYFALSTYNVLPDQRAFLILSGLEELASQNKACVGHLVSMSDNELSWLVGADKANALRDWQEQSIGIPRGTKVFGWRPPAQPFMGF